MNPKKPVPIVVPSAPDSAELSVEVWEAPFDRWLRLTEELVSDPARSTVLPSPKV